MRVRLYANEAKELGFEPKDNEFNRKQARYTIPDDKIDLANDIIDSRKIPNKRKFVETLHKKDKDGNVISSTEKLQSDPIGVPDNFEVIKISTSQTTGQQWVQYAPKSKELAGVDIDHIKKTLKKELKRTYKYTPKPYNVDKEGVLKWADLHFGAHIRNLVLTPDYDKDTLLNGLLRSIEDINSFEFKKAHIHINGDLIESFSGLNHINSWMSMDKDLIGANSIKLCVDLLDKALKEVNNLGTIKIVAGNHDRLSKDNKEDVKGGAADLIAWGLELKGYDVEFHPFIITHLVDGINHINLHGHCGISKKTTTDIIWNYGQKGKYNYVFEAHLHSKIQKASINRNISLVSDDSIDYRRETLQSFFTGNYYSETLGYTTNAGYKIIWDNGHGKPYELNNTI